MLEINGQPIAAVPAPEGLSIKIMDLDDADATERVVSGGKLVRSRIAVKRQIDLTYGALRWSVVSALLQQLADEFVDVTYPDPMTGTMATKTFYVSDRPAVAAMARDGEIWWTGVQFTLTEQ